MHNGSFRGRDTKYIQISQGWPYINHIVLYFIHRVMYVQRKATGIIRLLLVRCFHNHDAGRLIFFYIFIYVSQTHQPITVKISTNKRKITVLDIHI